MSNPTPAITFRVNLALLATEQIGPNTNLVNPHVLHPDMHQDSPDNGRFEMANRKKTRSTWTPSYFPGGQIRTLKDGDEFVEYGVPAVYLRDNYAFGFAPDHQAVLEVVSVA